MESFTLIITGITNVFLEVRKMTMQKMQFGVHFATEHFVALQ